MAQKPSEQLPATLGFVPGRREKITTDVLGKVLAKVKAERLAEAETRAEGIVKQALELAEKHDKTRKDFAKADEAFEKALGGLLAQLGGASASAEATAPEGAAPAEKAGQ